MFLAVRSLFCRLAGVERETQAEVIETRELLHKAFEFGREVGREEARGGGLRTLH
jgi:hypothetical protein